MEASSLNFSVSSFGDDRHKSKVSRMVTLESVVDWIRAKGLDSYTEKGLIDQASRYPTNSLISFKKNFNLMVSRVRKQRTQEIGDFVSSEPILDQSIKGVPNVTNAKEVIEKESCLDQDCSGF